MKEGSEATVLPPEPQPADASLRALEGGEFLLSLSGAWMHRDAKDASFEALFARVDSLQSQDFSQKTLKLDLSALERCDTFGALKIRQLIQQLGFDSSKIHLTGQHSPLIDEVLSAPPLNPTVPRRWHWLDVFEGLGSTTRAVGQDVLDGLDMAGAFMRALGSSIVDRHHFRHISFVHQLDRVAVQGLPIVLLISFIVGAIVAQQGLFQLEKFGASAFVINLLGILVFRELGVLLAAIMVVGRSGSAFTAEIGSMKMREEIDALRVMGLDPVHVLVVPRVLALMVGLPLLSIAGSLAALFGGALVSLIYGGISLELFIERLHGSIGANTVFVGLIKAPFLALVIGVIACVEGLAVKGSAESLGRQTTSSVVKSIFIVIVLDGLFAMFFAAISY